LLLTPAMPISGLVLTLIDEPAARARALEALSAEPRVTLGQEFGARLAVVTETATLGESRDLAESLIDIEGVALLEVVMVDFSDTDLGAA